MELRKEDIINQMSKNVEATIQSKLQNSSLTEVQRGMVAVWMKEMYELGKKHQEAITVLEGSDADMIANIGKIVQRAAGMI